MIWIVAEREEEEEEEEEVLLTAYNKCDLDCGREGITKWPNSSSQPRWT